MRSSDRVLIKPNLVMWDEVFAFPKYGVLTTSVVVEEVVKVLKEAGVQHITIGEASAESGEMGSGTWKAYEGLGYRRLQDKYNVILRDFNEGPFVKEELGPFNLRIAEEALESDYTINLPVLKTHNSTKVSLGFKNLKGCLHQAAKKHCHHVETPLDRFISFIGERLYSDITLIDGIYTLERGPAVNGTAHRSDILVASCDMYSADAAGSMLMGFKPEEIGHLRDYAERKGISLEENPEVTGESLEEFKMSLKWDWGWKEDNSGPSAFEKMGITGVNYPKYDHTICSGCSFLNNLVLILLIGAYDGTPFPNIEFLSGKKMKSQGGYDKTFLFGNCMVKVNKDNSLIKEAVPIKGCPPGEKEIVEVLNNHGIPVNIETYRQYRQSLAERYRGREEFDEDMFYVE